MKNVFAFLGVILFVCGFFSLFISFYSVFIFVIFFLLAALFMRKFFIKMFERMKNNLPIVYRFFLALGGYFLFITIIFGLEFYYNNETIGNSLLKFEFIILSAIGLYILQPWKWKDVWQNTGKKYFFMSIVFLVVSASGWHFLKKEMLIDSCLDMGDVWDYDEERCRTDCITWTKESGCVKIEK